MSIVSDDNILAFMGITEEYFTVNASSDSLILSYDGGVATTVDVPDGTYSPDQIATAAQSAINTAFTISCTVAWSSTTRKFTFTAPVGKTFAYTNTGSEAGTTFGFDQDHAAANAITSDNATGDPSAMVLSIRDAAESAIEAYCRRTFASTTYTLEKYSTNGTRYIYLNNYPVTSIQMIAVGTRDAMYVYNTNETSYASVSVTSAAVVLSRDGSTDATLTFVANTTISAMVTAINAVGNGWVAVVSSSDFNNFKSSMLISKFGQSAIDSNYVYLKIPEVAEYDYEVNENNGIVELSWSPKTGFRNVYVTYVAGYSTFPDDLQYAVKVMVKSAYTQYQDETHGLSSYSIGDVTKRFGGSVNTQNTIDSSMVPEVRDILAKYRKVLP